MCVCVCVCVCVYFSDLKICDIRFSEFEMLRAFIQGTMCSLVDA